MGSKANNTNDKENESIIADAMMDESIIAKYLESHPDFFQRHADLLTNIQVPHGAGTASLIERQVAILREKSRDLEGNSTVYEPLVGMNKLLRACNDFTLELMRADGIDDVIGTCQEVLREDFNADFVTLKIIGGDDTMHFVDPKNKNLKNFDNLFKTKRPICGRLNDEQQSFLFEKNTDVVNSTALVPLFSTGKLGILALGSKDETRFPPWYGKLFLSATLVNLFLLVSLITLKRELTFFNFEGYCETNTLSYPAIQRLPTIRKTILSPYLRQLRTRFKTIPNLA